MDDGATLAKAFPKNEVSLILEEAAMASKDAKKLSNALHFLNLAERYDLLLDMLIEKLVSVAKDEHSPDRM